MELGQLRAIRELGERGSIAAVAEAMHVTPSSISQQIAALQRHSPVPLTQRDGRRTVLTEAGRTLAAAAVDVEVALQRARRTVASPDLDAGRPVSIAAFHSASRALFVPLLLSTGAEDAPAVMLHDFDVAQEDFPPLVAEHDLVIAHRLSGSPAWPSWVSTRSLFLEPLDVAMRVGHPLAGDGPIQPADLADASWVAVHEGFPLLQAVSVIATLSGRSPRVAHRINDLSVATGVVAATDAIALMPRYTAALEQHRDVVLRPLAVPGFGRHVDCLARPEQLERPDVRATLDRILAIAAALRAAGTA
ncbi:LysR family transcriptional regulator [Agrococcus versicolor]|uniref:LysR family transcriptional regulator n=1 Tax=Agrococcus versicolor TaxID=501482 RepID=A0ABP5MGJ1_9MICO